VAQSSCGTVNEERSRNSEVVAKELESRGHGTAEQDLARQTYQKQRSGDLGGGGHAHCYIWWAVNV
jgi:hypothetical protein